MKELLIRCLQSYPLEMVAAFSFDEFSNHLYTLNQRIIKKYAYSHKSLQLISQVELDLPDSEILSFQFIMETDSLIIVYRDGNMVKVKDGELEKGQFDCGLVAAAWNPNQEQLIVVCSDAKLVSFDVQLDPKNEIFLDRFVDAPSSISFKNDGTHFSVNHAVQGGRICQTYDTELNVFQSVSKSDPEGGPVQAIFERPRQLANCVAWQPNVGYIAGVEANQTIFWEKNGLRHLEFENEKEGVRQLKWSPDGTILALQFEDQINLYVRSNYKWYLKRVIDGKAIGFTFLERQETNALAIFYMNEMLIYWLGFDYIEGYGISTDGKRLLVTDFKKVVIPPPLAQHTLELEGYIELVHVDELIFVYTSNGFIYIYNLATLLGKVEFKLGRVHKMVYRREISDNEMFGALLFVEHFENTDRVFELLISKEFEVVQAWKKGFSQQTQITAVCQNFTKTTLHSRFNERFVYLLYNDPPIAEFEGNLQEKSYDVKIRYAGELFAALKSNQKLVFNHQVISNECTSFMFYGDFLVFTATTPGLFHMLYVVDLRKPIIIDKKALNASNVERGAKLLAIGGLDRVILQVPRGNLETLAPRVMSLYMAKGLFEKKNYKECYEHIRRHKLDMNLLFDFNPQQAFEDCGLIVQSLKESYLQIFIQSIKNQVSFELPYVVSEQEYKAICAYINEQVFGTTKINLICQALIKNMDEQTHILTIVTAMLRKEPTEVEQALQKVVALKKAEQEDDVELPPHLNPITNKRYRKEQKAPKSDQVLEYICWLADANKMFEVALGTYDFELVKQVAQFTQKDPKEYLPLLEKYQAIADPIEMKATIQIELKNFDKAIQVLSKGSEQQLNRSLELIKKHERFICGIECYKDTALIKRVKEMLGDHMMKQKQNHQASLAYESAGLYAKAMMASMEIMDTKRVLSFRPKKEELQDLQDHLAQAGKWKDCGLVAEYLGQTKEAVHFYCKSENWKKVAICLRSEEVNVDISEELKLCYSIKSNQLAQQQQLFTQKLERLKVVQASKKERGILAPSQVQADFDAMSDVSHKSGASKTSYTMSVTTGVRKKKQQKEKSFLNRNIKEGSPVEEEYLVEHLKNIQSQSVGIINQIKQFQNYLIFFNQPNLSRELSKKVNEYLQTIKVPIKSLALQMLEEQHPESEELFGIKPLTFEFQQQLDSLIH